ncbi:MAG: outer membrane protein transport protein [Anaerolineae bacterium]|nr:outer membrane protein transport protein [Gemmatimonadaceae bacterium]
MIKLGRTSLLLAAVLGLNATARAQAFGLNEIGTCAVGRAHTGTGSPCADPSVIYWNPAAATMLKKWTVYAGAAAIHVTGDFSADSSADSFPSTAPTEFPPHLFVNYKGNGKWAAGLGVYIPYGLTTQWKENFPGRFLALKSSLLSFYAQPNIAFEFRPGWSVGGGPVIGYSKVELTQALDLAPVSPSTGITFAQLGIAPGTEFGRATLKGSSTALGFHVGLHGQLTQTVQVGARYLSEVKFNYDGADARFEQRATGLILPQGNPLIPGGASAPLDPILAAQFASGGVLVPQGVSTTIEHPAQIQAGAGFSGLPNTLVSLDYFWVGYGSAFRELAVTFDGPAEVNNGVLIQDYDNAWAIRAGLEYSLGRQVVARGGYSYVRAAAPAATVTPLLPDMDRRHYTLGFGLPFLDRYWLDAAYLRVDTEGRRGRVIERESRTQTASDLNGGFYLLKANIFSLSVRAQF